MANSQNKSSFLDYIKSSAISVPQAFCIVSITQPLKNAQLLQQLNPKSESGLNTFSTLYHRGIKDSFKGTSSSVIKMSLQNALFNPAILLADRSLSDEFIAENPITSSAVKSFVGTLGKLSTYPIDTFLVRMLQQDSTPIQTAKEMWNQPSFAEKVKCSFKGALPETIKQLVGNAVFFLIKDQISDLKENLNLKNKGDNKLSATDTIFVGMMVAAIKNAVTHPIDLLSKTMQDPDNKIDSVKDAVNILQKRVSQTQSIPESLKIVYRGYPARTALSAVATSATIGMLEIMKNGRDIER